MMIRKIMEQDYKELKNIFYQVHELHYEHRPDIYVDENPLSLEYFNEILKDDSSYNYVYEENGRICGFLMATKKSIGTNPMLKKRTTCFIDSIAVDKNSRGRGIGKKLYYFLKEQASKEDIDAIG